MKKIAALIFISGVCNITCAADTIDCLDPKGSYEEVECAARKNKETDNALNEILKKKKKEMEKGQTRLLVAAQKGWLQLRDSQCLLEVFAIKGTTGYHVRHLICLAEMTALRVKQLELTPTDSSTQ